MSPGLYSHVSLSIAKRLIQNFAVPARNARTTSGWRVLRHELAT